MCNIRRNGRVHISFFFFLNFLKIAPQNETGTFTPHIDTHPINNKKEKCWGRDRLISLGLKRCSTWVSSLFSQIFYVVKGSIGHNMGSPRNIKSQSNIEANRRGHSLRIKEGILNAEIRFPAFRRQLLRVLHRPTQLSL